MSVSNRKLKVLVSAYACEPHRGSEPGVGWNWAKQIAEFAEAWVITRANNRGVIEAEINRNLPRNLHFVYVDLPKYLRFWKKGQTGVHLYYCLWQFTAFLKALSLVRKISFDIAHHVTFVNDWLPSFLSFLNIPFIWGPIGSHPWVPLQYISGLNTKILELIRRLVQTAFRFFNPLFYVTAKRAKVVVAISSDFIPGIFHGLIQRDKMRYQVANAVDCTIHARQARHRNRSIRILSVGRLIYFKGFEIALRAFSSLHSVDGKIRLAIIGDGMDNSGLNRLARTLNVRARVDFLGLLPRTRVLEYMRRCDIFLFPSFEGGGMVVLEAMAAGLPVVCLDYGGPGEMVTDECGIKVKLTKYDETVQNLADALIRLSRDAKLRSRMGKAGIRRVKKYYTWEKKREFIKELYNSVLIS